MRRLPLLAALIAAACAAPPPAPVRALVERTEVVMGSPLRLAAWTTDEPAMLATFDGVFREFDRLDGLLSVWRDGSDVVRLNAAAGGAPVRVSADTLEVLALAAQAGDWTRGKFDITFGALAGLWKFDHDQDGSIPDRAAVAARLPLVDYRGVGFDRAAGTAWLARAGMRVHLGGIGKGYGVDRAIARLREGGARDFLIQAGGDLYVAGTNGDRPWRVGIQDPRGTAGASFATLDVTNVTVSTSGDYERAFVKDGVRYHHLIDPDAGEPARLCRSVTIVADRAVLADALSTGVFILGPADGLALVESLAGVEAVIVGADNAVTMSSGLRGKVRMLAPPAP